jgi:hypothetical protein
MNTLRVGVLAAVQPDPQFLPVIRAALHVRGIAQRVSVRLIANSRHVTAKSNLDLNLLMGLDHDQHPLQAIHNAIRQTLVKAGAAYQVLYGTPEEKIDLILRLIEQRLNPAAKSRIARHDSARPWVWACEKCSDPSCEHQLLTGLLSKKAAALTER